MAAYVVIDRLSMTDAATFRLYHDPAQAAVTGYGGLEGNWKPNRIVLIEFDDADQARRWWDSPEYAEARAIHREATISNIILVDGES